MVKSDREKFVKIFCTLCEIFSKEPTEILIEGYFRALSKFSIQEVEVGISSAIVSLKFWPKPVELIELISGGPGKLEDKAMVEAGKVLEAIKQVGSYDSVAFDDPITQAVIRYGFGGWIKLCDDLKADENKWFIKDFVKIYQSYLSEQIRFFGHLPGIIESQNTNADYLAHNKGPVLIGDHKKAKKIAETKQEGDQFKIDMSAKQIPLNIGDS